ncbi:MAG: ArsR/SmtB family transcription factor [Actinomycetota bacterium]
MQAVLDAISSPRRREILRLIWNGELSAGEIAARSDVSWPAVSQNLKVLRTAGLVTERREGTKRIYRADPVALGPLQTFLRQMWEQDLDALDRTIERDRRG